MPLSSKFLTILIGKKIVKTDQYRVAQKRPEHLHTLFTRAVEINQCKSICVMTKHLRIGVGIFA